MNNVFISFSSKDSITAEKVADYLEGCGLDVWICTRSLVGGSVYDDEIYRAIRSSSILVVIQSKFSVISTEVPKEIKLAAEFGLPIIPFAIDNSEFVDGSAYQLVNVHKINAYEISFEEGLHRLIRDIKSKSASSCISRNPDTSSPAIPRLKNLVPLSPGTFVGREKELSEIRACLEKERIVFINGVGGTGKTKLSLEYAKRYASCYDTVIVAHYESSISDLIVSERYFVSNISREINENETEFARRKLKAIKGSSDTRTLIILDNFDTDDDELLEELMNGPYCLIITTRNNFDHLGLVTIYLSELNEGEQEELFLKHYKKTISDSDRYIIKDILKTVGGHTLTVELVAKLMASKRLSPAAMLEQLKRSGISPEIAGNIKHGFKKSNTVYGHIEALFNLDLLTDYEMGVMISLSLVPISGMNVDAFLSLTQIDDFEVIDNLYSRSWLKYDIESDVISIHPVISDIVYRKGIDKFNLAETYVNNLTKKLKNLWSISKEEKQSYCEAAKRLYRKMPENYCKNINVCLSLLNAFKVMDNRELTDDITERLSSEFSSLSVERCWVLWNISDVHLWYQRFDEAEVLTRSAIKDLKSLRDYPYDTAYMLKHLAHILHAKCQHIGFDTSLLLEAKLCLDESEECFRFALCNQHLEYGSYVYRYGLDLDKEHDSQSGSRYYAYATNSYFRGDYEESLKYATISYELFVKINGEVDSDTTAPMRVMAMAYSKLGKTIEAIEMQKKVVYIRSQLWGKDSFRYFEQLEFLADIYLDNGMLDDACSKLCELTQLLKDDTLYSDYRRKIALKLERCSISRKTK